MHLPIGTSERLTAPPGICYTRLDARVDYWPTHNASQALRLYGRFQTRNPCFFSCGRGQVAHAGGTLCKAAPLVPAFHRDAGGADGRSRGEQLEAVRGTEPWATANKQRVAELMARRALHVHVCIVSMWGSTQEPQARGARATAARAVSPAVTARARAHAHQVLLGGA
jgi:hypothetical protein